MSLFDLEATFILLPTKSLLPDSPRPSEIAAHSISLSLKGLLSALCIKTIPVLDIFTVWGVPFRLARVNLRSLSHLILHSAALIRLSLLSGQPSLNNFTASFLADPAVTYGFS